MESPNIDLRKLPETERKIAFHISGKLSDLGRLIKAFKLALLFFNQCGRETTEIVGQITTSSRETKSENRDAAMERMRADEVLFERLDVLSGWMFMAARDASMSVYHFRTTLYAVIQNTKNTEKLQELVKVSELVAAADEFETDFPNVTGLRHSIAHQADNTFTPKHMEKHSIKPSGNMYSSNLEEDLFSYSYEGEFVALRISSETLASLRKTQRKFYDAFLSTAAGSYIRG